jgi:hypothetical protein
MKNGSILKKFILTLTYLHSIQTGSGAHPASYPMGTGGLSVGVK